MLAMDVPVALMSGLVLAEGGKNLLKSEEKEKITFVKVVVLMYAAIFIAPTPVYYFMGWPSWEVNFMWKWVDNIHDSPLKAASSYVLLACCVVPTYIGYALGHWFIKKGKDSWVRIGYITMLILVGVIIFVLRDITFNVWSTYENYKSIPPYSFWTHPFVTGWALSALYFWISLGAFYMWLSKKS